MPLFVILSNSSQVFQCSIKLHLENCYKHNLCSTITDFPRHSIRQIMCTLNPVTLANNVVNATVQVVVANKVHFPHVLDLTCDVKNVTFTSFLEQWGK